MTDRLIRITTALAVVAVAVAAAIISHQHAYELVRSHGESGVTARLLPFTVDGLIWAASMVILDASRRNQPVPRLAAWSLGAGIVATVGANLAHGVGHGPVGALVSAWPALALVGSFELLMMLIRTGRGARPGEAEPEPWHQVVPPLVQEASPELTAAPARDVRRGQPADPGRGRPAGPRIRHPQSAGLAQLADRRSGTRSWASSAVPSADRRNRAYPVRDGERHLRQQPERGRGANGGRLGGWMPCTRPAGRP